MKLVELFESISISHIRTDLYKIIQDALYEYAGTLEIFEKDFQGSLPGARAHVDKLKVIEKQLEKFLKPYGVKRVNIQGMPEAKFHDQTSLKGSFDRLDGELMFMIPFELVDKNNYFGDDKRDEYTGYICAVISHEIIHSIQAKRNKSSTQQSVQPFDADGNENFRNYLGSSKEIEAHAVNSSQMLMQKFKNKDLVLKSIKRLENNEEIKSLLGSSIEKYFIQFAKSDKSKDKIVWKRFLKKLYQHIVDY